MSDVQKFGEEFQRVGKDGFDASVRALGEVNKGFQAIAATVTDYSKKAFEDGTRAFEQLIGAKSFEQAFEIQSQYANKAFDGYIAQLSKLAEMYVDLTRNAYKPVEQAAAKTASGNKPAAVRQPPIKPFVRQSRNVASTAEEPFAETPKSDDTKLEDAGQDAGHVLKEIAFGAGFEEFGGDGAAGVPGLIPHDLRRTTCRNAWKATGDRRLAKAHVSVHMGGATSAVAHYQESPTPNLIIIESQLDRNLFAARADVARAREFSLGRVPANLTVNANLNLSVNATGNLGFVIPTYVFETPVLGGQASVSVVAAYGVVGTRKRGLVTDDEFRELSG